MEEQVDNGHNGNVDTGDCQAAVSDDIRARQLSTTKLFSFQMGIICELIEYD